MAEQSFTYEINLDNDCSFLSDLETYHPNCQALEYLKDPIDMEVSVSGKMVFDYKNQKLRFELTRK